jgi:hypothetical protein
MVEQIKDQKLFTSQKPNHTNRLSRRIRWYTLVMRKGGKVVDVPAIKFLKQIQAGSLNCPTSRPSLLKWRRVM